MVLIKSISGVRGTVDNNCHQGLSDFEVRNCVIQFAKVIVEDPSNDSTIAVGRDGRSSGAHIINLVISTLTRLGINVLNLDLTTTPSVQLAIINEYCCGGIMISASHNPINWNGLKLLNSKGEFLSKSEGDKVFKFSTSRIKLSHSTGSIKNINYLNKHIDHVLGLSDLDLEKIKLRNFKIVVDGINSSGGIYIPYLLRKMGVDVIELNCIANGQFAHNPEPIPENLKDLCNMVIAHKADLGVAVDPDVDRLVLICDDGNFFGEEYTIVAVAKYILSKHPKSSIVTNLSTTRSVKDIADSLGAQHFESAVGEINVVELMKKNNAVIGGEGSGGVIFSKSHYGRDAIVGVALILSFLAQQKQSISRLRSTLPNYYMLKDKISIPKDLKFEIDRYILEQIEYCKNDNSIYSNIDGIKIYYNCGGWSHVRSSNTEPIVRIIIEAHTKKRMFEIKKRLINDINNYLK